MAEIKIMAALFTVLALFGGIVILGVLTVGSVLAAM